VEWLGERGRDGGVDTVPLPCAQGALSLCGKHAIAPDPQAAMARCGATTVVCLVELREVEAHWPMYAEWVRANDGGTVVWFPIHDLHAPSLAHALEFLDDVGARLQRGEHVLMHCAAGIGRAGTMAACILVHLGTPVAESLSIVRAARPMAGPEVGPQLELVHAIAAAQRGSP
jgi:protein-tyrosine phosphatase